MSVSSVGRSAPVAAVPSTPAAKPPEPVEAPAVKVSISPEAAKAASRDVDHDGDAR